MLPASSSATSQAAGQSTTQAPPKPPLETGTETRATSGGAGPPQITVLTVWLDDPDDDRPRRAGVRSFAPYCGSRERPYWRQQISSGGWVVFAVLLVLFWPLCFLGLFIKDVRSCYECGIQFELGVAGNGESAVGQRLALSLRFAPHNVASNGVSASGVSTGTPVASPHRSQFH